MAKNTSAQRLTPSGNSFKDAFASAKKDESLADRFGKGKGTKKERDLAYGKWGKRRKDWKKSQCLEQSLEVEAKQRPIVMVDE